MSRSRPEPWPTPWWQALRARPLLMGADGGAAVWDGRRRWPDLATWCAAHPRGRVRLWLSGRVLHELVCDDDLPLADDAAVLSWAGPLLQHYHGEAAQAWPLAAWQHGRRRGVSALHGVAATALQGARARLRSASPWWSLVVRRALSRCPLLRGSAARLLVVEGACVTVITLRRGRLHDVQPERLDAATPAALAAWDAEAPPLPGVAVGYGLAPGTVDGLECLGPLDDPLPAAPWLRRTPA